MNRRGLLRQNLKDAWQSAIADDYYRQRINSERSLQASLWSKLNEILPKARRMFIEPKLKATVEALDGQVNPEFRFPDIVICNTKEVIGIVEVKYLPRAKPNWQKDLNTFSWINTNRDQIVIQNIRYRGVTVDDREYPLSEDVLFVWAGVHALSGIDLAKHINPELSRHFLALHAETTDGEHPTIR